MPALTPKRRRELKDTIAELFECYEATGTLDSFIDRAKERGSTADTGTLCLMWYAFEFAAANKL